MTEKKPADHFADVRGRLAQHWPKQTIDAWFQKEHQRLGMRSPARMIHSGEHQQVHALVDEIEKNGG